MIINNKRALAYTARIDKISSIKGADSIELATIKGWNVITKIGEFKKGDICVYFEIDSKVPEAPWSEFLRAKHFKIKTMKIGKFNVISQGLAVPLKNFNMKIPNQEGIDLTDKLGVVYAESEDNIRKADPAKMKYLAMASRRPKLFKKGWVKWLMRRTWGRKLMYAIFGSSKDKAPAFPTFASKTDEERCENIPEIVNDSRPFVVTEKLDGTSCTYALERIGRNKFKYYVASRNQCILPEDSKDKTIYWELEDKYKICEHLTQYLKLYPALKWVYIQGEGVGSVQGNPLKLKENDLYLFNFVTSESGRLSSFAGKSIVNDWGIKWVPIIGTVQIPRTMSELKAMATGKSIVNPEVLREGLVFRTLDGKESFKNVSKEYLLSKKGK